MFIGLLFAALLLFDVKRFTFINILVLCESIFILNPQKYTSRIIAIIDNFNDYFNIIKQKDYSCECLLNKFRIKF